MKKSNSDIDCAKMQRLSSVFSKALDVALASVDKDTLNNCFEGYSKSHGSIIETALMNQLEKSRVSIEVHIYHISII